LEVEMVLLVIALFIAVSAGATWLAVKVAGRL
jgi:hypothetical protein